MKNLLYLFLIFASSFFMLNSHAYDYNDNMRKCYTDPRQIKLSSSLRYKLMPNKAQRISNQYLFSVSATCIIKNKDEDNFLSIKVLKKQGALNNELLVKGDSKVIRLKYKDKFNITAIPGAKVQVLNVGNNPIISECVLKF